MSLGTLLNGHLILADGAMGTYYQERFKKRNPETQNIRHPERIVAIHREYLAAGARLLRTNSFASNLETLLGREQEELPREQQLSVISENVRAAYGNALLAVEQEGLRPWGQELPNAEISPKTAVYLAGDIGPIPERGREEEELLEEYQAMVDALLTAVTLQCGVDALDPDDTSKVLGKRLVLPRFNFLEMRTKYEVHARKDEESGGYIIGVAERSPEEQDDGQA